MVFHFPGGKGKGAALSWLSSGSARGEAEQVPGWGSGINPRMQCYGLLLFIIIYLSQNKCFTCRGARRARPGGPRRFLPLPPELLFIPSHSLPLHSSGAALSLPEPTCPCRAAIVHRGWQPLFINRSPKEGLCSGLEPPGLCKGSEAVPCCTEGRSPKAAVWEGFEVPCLGQPCRAEGRAGRTICRCSQC